jgi:hypothetical protein
MRYTICFLCFCFLQSCADHSTNSSPIYESLLFVREGAGSKVFNVYPASIPQTFLVNVTRYEFRDTSVQMLLVKDNTYAPCFDALMQTLQGQTQIVGDFKQSTLPTGTWSYLYVVKGSEQIEITNTDLRNVLSNFENIVRAKMQ